MHPRRQLAVPALCTRYTTQLYTVPQARWRNEKYQVSVSVYQVKPLLYFVAIPTIINLCTTEPGFAGDIGAMEID